MADQMELQLIFDIVDQSSRDLQKIAAGLNKVKDGYKKSTEEQGKYEKQTKKTTSILKKQFNILNTPLGRVASVAAIGTFLGKSIKKSLDFADGLAEVATLTNKSAAEITASFKPIVQSIQTTYGKDSTDTIRALYDGISAGIPSTESAVKSYLDAVAKMSIGGRATMTESGDLITTVMNAWKTSGITAEQAANSIFGAVKMGKTTVAELSASFGQVASDANAAGANIEETASAIAALTSIGIKTPEAMTKLRAVMKSLKSPVEGSAKAFAKLGIKSVGGMMQNFKGNKFVQTIEEIDKRVRKTTKGTAEYNAAIAKLFPDQMAASAFTSLMTNANNNFNQSLKETAMNGGQVSNAYSKMQTDALALKKVWQEVDVVMEQFGAIIAPGLGAAARQLSEIMSNLKLIVDNADHITLLNQQEGEALPIQGTIDQKAAAMTNKMYRGRDESFELGGSEWQKEKSFNKKILEVRIESAGMTVANQKTSSQVAAEILPELKKYLNDLNREDQRKGLGKQNNFVMAR